MADDPYQVLHLDPRADDEEIRRAYFRLVRQYPPEGHPDEFKRVRAAYETLRSPTRRVELALTTFDATVVEIDLDLIARAAGPSVPTFDAAAVLLAVERGLSDLARTDFQDDLTPVRVEDLLVGPGNAE